VPALNIQIRSDQIKAAQIRFHTHLSRRVHLIKQVVKAPQPLTGNEPREHGAGGGAVEGVGRLLLLLLLLVVGLKGLLLLLLRLLGLEGLLLLVVLLLLLLVVVVVLLLGV